MQGSSGSYTYGEVTNTGLSVMDKGDDRTFSGISEMKILNGEPAHGDSGAPFWIINSFHRAFCGVQSGIRTGYSYFTPYYYPHRVVGFEAKTTN